MTQLTHCIYASLATEDFEEHDIPALLKHARISNATRGLTGMLLYIGGNFFQVLEGEESIVDSVYAHILRDPRHRQVTLIIREPIANRSFSEWTMGFSTVDPVDAGKILGENDFFKSASCIARLDSGRAKKLLSAFQGGRWRIERTGTHPTTGHRG
jgi:hypothetical protein